MKDLSRVFDHLRAWAALPKYSVERRVDVLLSPFLEEYLGARLAGDSGGRPVRLIAPEFPLRHREVDFLTVSLDYLLLAENPRAWIFLELKTDVTSVDDDQCALYTRMQGAGVHAMRAIVRDLVEVGLRTKNLRLATKYRRVLQALHAALLPPADLEHLSDPEIALALIGTAQQPGPVALPIEVAYLSPVQPRRRVDHFLPIRDLAKWRPTEPGTLWPLIAELLADVGDGAPVRGSRVPWLERKVDPKDASAWIADVTRERGTWTSVYVEHRAGSTVLSSETISRAAFEEGQGRWARALRGRARRALATLEPNHPDTLRRFLGRS